MRRFSQLFRELDATTRTNEKVAALERYFNEVPPEDAVWALWFLCGHRPSQPIPVKKLRLWAAELASIPEWLFAECYDAVGDLAETIALLLPPPAVHVEHTLSWWVGEVLLKLRSAEEERQKTLLQMAWHSLDADERFVWNKLITGGFRVGVSQQLIVRAISHVTGLSVAVLAHRLMGDWKPTTARYLALIAPEGEEVSLSRPYPFCLAHPLETEPRDLGDVSDWQVEWKWDGIRAQLIHRQQDSRLQGEVFLWSRGEELITDAFPELQPDAGRLPPGTVLDGEILVLREGRVQPFAQLQRRIGRKSVGKKILADVPVGFMAFDLLEADGLDLRNEPLEIRRGKLEQLLVSLPLSNVLLAPLVEGGNWDELAAARQTSRERLVEGLMLKRRSSLYQAGRARGDWWKWKIEPMTIDAVLIYAQQGHGRRASLFSDYTFAVWEAGVLVPFAKAYSGLTDEEMREVDKFVREHTTERFGPVRGVTPELVFELGFENIQESPRHKSGIAVRFPRMLRWRKDKTPDQADHLEEIRRMLRAINQSHNQGDHADDDRSSLDVPTARRSFQRLLFEGDE